MSGTVTRGDELLEIAQAVEAAIGRPSRHQQELLASLDRLVARHRGSSFQLAVLGQFKRGKSSLLNAFVGYPLLGTGVLPLTAVPTFLSGASALQVRLTRASGTREECAVADLGAVADAIAAATTEERNPRNKKGILRVDASLIGNAWLDAVTLVDTPGIGSTNAHNTDAAYAVLSECDAALFVCSVDPPITEVEVAYLKRICANVPQVIVVLNKIDLVDPEDASKAVAFLSTVICEQAGPRVDRRVFPVSARHALSARQAFDDEGFEASGLAALERHVRAQLVDRKQKLLDQSVAGKMFDLVAALTAEASMIVRALSLPLVDLDAKIAEFERAAIEFERERVTLNDALRGEQERTLQRLKPRCDGVDKRVRADLDAVIAHAVSVSSAEAGAAGVSVAMTESFDREFSELASTVKADLEAAIATHRDRHWALAQRVRAAAGDLFEVAVPPLVAGDWFLAARETYWVGERQQETVTSLTIDGLARLLPAAIKRRRQEKRYREAVGRALTRNISELHWTMRQNIDDSFRRLVTTSGETVEAAIASTRDLLATSYDRRQAKDASLRLDLENARLAERRLSELKDRLAA